MFVITAMSEVRSQRSLIISESDNNWTILNIKINFV